MGADHRADVAEADRVAGVAGGDQELDHRVDVGGEAVRDLEVLDLAVLDDPVAQGVEGLPAGAGSAGLLDLARWRCRGSA